MIVILKGTVSSLRGNYQFLMGELPVSIAGTSGNYYPNTSCKASEYLGAKEVVMVQFIQLGIEESCQWKQSPFYVN